MFQPFLNSLAIAAIFYVLLPVLGAFRVRHSWRFFRRLMADSARVPFLDYGRVREGLALCGGKATGSGSVLGTLRLFGSIEAMEGKDRLWVRGTRACGNPASASIDMGGALIYSLPGDGSEFEAQRALSGKEPCDYSETEESPERLSWKSLPALPEGTKVFVYGKVVLEGGKAEFRGNRKGPVLVLIYEGSEDSLLLRATRQGRHSNEYWNKLTPLSFLTGIMAMMAVLLSVARGFTLPLVRLLVSLTACLPLSVFLPPGLFCFFLYREMWKRARSYRASRDMLRLPCAAFAPGTQETTLPDGEKYLRLWVPVSKPGKADLPGDMPLRGADEWSPRSSRIPGYTCFGSPAAGNPGRLVKPKDCLADFTAIPGIPETFSRRCSDLAHRYTLAAGLSLFAAAAVNCAMLFFILRRLI